MILKWLEDPWLFRIQHSKFMILYSFAQQILYRIFERVGLWCLAFDIRRLIFNIGRIPNT